MTVSNGTRSWQEIAHDYQKHRDETVARVDPAIPDAPAKLPLNVTGLPKQLLSAREIEITEQTVPELKQKLSTGEWKCVDVIKAFLRRAGLGQKLVNCVAELLPERAIKRAEELDQYLEEHKRPIGPLHGIPISVKEHLGMKGLDLNAGFCSFVGKVPDEDAHLLKILWEAGCVFYVRSTQPQTLMHLETSSNLCGVTVNPFNRALTCGGSSGGEGALQGIGGSILGIGSDIGGSIRSPAANNGAYGFRPSTYRLPTGGYASAMPGADSIVGVVGPLSNSLEGIELFMQTVIDAQPWLKEPSLVPLPWKQPDPNWFTDHSGKFKIKVGVLWTDEVVKPHPPVLRALKEVVEKLKQTEGYEIVEWKPYKHDLAWDIIASLYFPDGGAKESAAIDSSGEPWRPLSEFIIKDNPLVKAHSIDDIWFWHRQRNEYRTDYAKLWNSTAVKDHGKGVLEGAVDVILCPVGPGAAPPINCARYWGYTSQWNLLDYPSVVFPVTKVKPDVDVTETDYKPLNDQDEYNYKLYEPELYRDAPVALQLVARRYEDEKVLKALELIQKATGAPFEK
ncbi:amidase [Xylona heveae TC161]|uniref:Amidase n=1 Tax=Xylona heveae (strain CBS 132557 / TC161) TaxID=1328760 RepID=A0A165JFU9_XYLHT|nr:amidase [Xylona heveae TC161]KZF26180.1 amidase [Xylona heveae TC161]